MNSRAPEGTTRQIAQYIVNARYEDIPCEHYEILKKSILDVHGAAIAGWNADGVDKLFEVIETWGGAPEASVLFRDFKCPAPNAAFLNAVMARALDYEDNEENGSHPTASIWPVVLACSELVENKNGKDMLLAFAVGRDVEARINLSNLEYSGFDPVTTTVVFGATAAAGKLLELNEDEMCNALGFALNECGGTFQSNIDGTLSVRINQGIAARNGIICAMLAKAGLSGVKNVFEGVYGYYHLFANDKALINILLDDLGKKFLGYRINFKRWPSCAQTAASTDLALEFASDGLMPDEIDHIDVRLSPSGFNLVGKPFSIGTNPAVDTQFNVRYCIANSLVRKRPSFEQFNDIEHVNNPDVLSLIERINVNADPSFITMPLEVDENDPLADVLKNRGHYLRSEIDIFTKDGKKISKAADYWKGYSQNPLTLDELIEKYRDSVAYGKGVVSSETAEAVLRISLNIEKLNRVEDLIKLLVK